MILAFAAWFALANLIAAGPWSWRQRLGLKGRSIYYAGLATIIVGAFTFGWPGFWAGVCFTLWRLPGWYGAMDAGYNVDPPEKSTILGFHMKNQRLRDFIVMSARGTLMFPIFVYYAFTLQSWSVLGILVAASLGQGLAYDFGWHTLTKVYGARELLAGLVWGLAFFTLFSAAGLVP